MIVYADVSIAVFVSALWEKPEAFFDEVPDERWLRLIDEANMMGIPMMTIAGGNHSFAPNWYSSYASRSNPMEWRVSYKPTEPL